MSLSCSSHFPTMHTVPPLSPQQEGISTVHVETILGNRYSFPVPLSPFPPRSPPQNLHVFSRNLQNKRNTYIRKRPQLTRSAVLAQGLAFAGAANPTHRDTHTHTFNNPWDTPGKCTTHTQTRAYLPTTVAAVGPPSSLLSVATNRQRKKRRGPTPPIPDQAGQDQPNSNAASFHTGARQAKTPKS